jgi:hypothetical protein
MEVPSAHFSECKAMHMNLNRYNDNIGRGHVFCCRLDLVDLQLKEPMHEMFVAEIFTEIRPV